MIRRTVSSLSQVLDKCPTGQLENAENTDILWCASNVRLGLLSRIPSKFLVLTLDVVDNHVGRRSARWKLTQILLAASR